MKVKKTSIKFIDEVLRLGGLKLKSFKGNSYHLGYIEYPDEDEIKILEENWLGFIDKLIKELINDPLIEEYLKTLEK